jgi:hypothetical protein
MRSHLPHNEGRTVYLPGRFTAEAMWRLRPGSRLLQVEAAPHHANADITSPANNLTECNASASVMSPKASQGVQ